MISGGIPDYDIVEDLLEYSIKNLLIEPKYKEMHEYGQEFDGAHATGTKSNNIKKELEALDIPLNITFTESSLIKSKEVA